MTVKPAGGCGCGRRVVRDMSVAVVFDGGDQYDVGNASAGLGEWLMGQ